MALGIPLALSLRDRVDAEVPSQAPARPSGRSDLRGARRPGNRRSLERLAKDLARTVRGRVMMVSGEGPW